ncbi:MAG: kinase [Oscillospiraceae bacterium]|nr:kinase [Oscillospiraceae bacterium]
MRKLVIIRGNSGSGKSTLAKRLQRELGRNTLVIPQDTVRREMLWARDGEDTAALPLLRTLLRYGYEHGNVTILEGIFYADWYRPLFQDAVELFGENVFAYYYDLPFEETLRRHETKPNRFDFGEEDMRRWWREKDYIGFIPEKIIGQDVPLEAAAERILSEIQII